MRYLLARSLASCQRVVSETNLPLPVYLAACACRSDKLWTETSSMVSEKSHVEVKKGLLRFCFALVGIVHQAERAGVSVCLAVYAGE